MLVVLPVLLLVGMLVVQYVLIFQARNALDYALNEAARQGAIDHASEAAVVGGLAAGLAPWLYGADGLPEKMLRERQAIVHVREGMALGWIRLAQRSPTLESFRDWAEPALDAHGEQIRGTDEIPNDNLDNRRLKAEPASGMAGRVHGEPVGRVSGQTLADANLLRLELHYGVRLGVPVVGKLVLETLQALQGCAGTAGNPLHDQGATAELDHCAFYRQGRIPVSAVATMRMMSPARRSSLLQAALLGQPRQGLRQGAGSVGNDGEVSGPAAGTGRAQPSSGARPLEWFQPAGAASDARSEAGGLPGESSVPNGDDTGGAPGNQASSATDAGATETRPAEQKPWPAMTGARREASEQPGGESLLDRLLPDRMPHPELCEVAGHEG